MQHSTLQQYVVHPDGTLFVLSARTVDIAAIMLHYTKREIDTLL
jgi:hypothetical protein